MPPGDEPLVKGILHQGGRIGPAEQALGIGLVVGEEGLRVRRQLLGAFGVQVVVALATAAIRPFTGLAFGILVPTYGLGLVGLWGARRGAFPPRGRSRDL